MFCRGFQEHSRYWIRGRSVNGAVILLRSNGKLECIEPRYAQRSGNSRSISWKLECLCSYSSSHVVRAQFEPRSTSSGVPALMIYLYTAGHHSNGYEIRSSGDGITEEDVAGEITTNFSGVVKNRRHQQQLPAANGRLLCILFKKRTFRFF